MNHNANTYEQTQTLYVIFIVIFGEANIKTNKYCINKNISQTYVNRT